MEANQAAMEANQAAMQSTINDLTADLESNIADVTTNIASVNTALSTEIVRFLFVHTASKFNYTFCSHSSIFLLRRLDILILLI